MLQTRINTVILSAAAAATGKLDDPCSHRPKPIFFRIFILSGQQVCIKPYHFKLRSEHDCSFSHFVWWRVQLVSSAQWRIWSPAARGPIQICDSHNLIILLILSHLCRYFCLAKRKALSDIGSRILQHTKPKSAILQKTPCLSRRHAAAQDSWHKTHDAPECFQFLHH